MPHSLTSIELVDYDRSKSGTAEITRPSRIKNKSENEHSSQDAFSDPHRNTTQTEKKVAPGNSTTAIVIVTVVCVTAISTLLSGLITVALPTLAHDLKLEPGLLLWPVSIYALTSGCTLLLLGSISDVVGSRLMYLTGCIFQSIATLACGLAQTGIQMIVFRAFAGIAISFCLPSAVSIITSTFPEGKRRNIAFAAMGGGQPIGFAIGLTMGGVLSDTIGWRWGFYIAAIINTAIFVIGFFGIPQVDDTKPDVWTRLRDDIDWIGIIIGSTSLAMLSYSFASITNSTSNITKPVTLTLLITSLALIPTFIFWMNRQETLHRPAVIPNSLWRNRIFTVICIGVFITWGIFNAIETYQTLFFQEVQQISAIQTSVRFLPTPISGALSNLVMGLIAHRVKANWAVIVGTGLTTIATLLMAVIQPEWTYWACAFPAVFLNPAGADAMFTVSNLVITSLFPAKTQALAGGVFNTIAQIGKSVGLATAAVIANSVTAKSGFGDKEGPEALMEGFRAAFWYLFALSCVTGGLFVWGLRGIGKVGMKRD